MKRGRAESRFVERDGFTSFVDPELGLDARHAASTIALPQARPRLTAPGSGRDQASRTLGRSATPPRTTGTSTSAPSVSRTPISTGKGAGRSPSFLGCTTPTWGAFSNLGVALATTPHGWH